MSLLKTLSEKEGNEDGFTEIEAPSGDDEKQDVLHYNRYVGRLPVDKVSLSADAFDDLGEDESPADYVLSEGEDGNAVLNDGYEVEDGYIVDSDGNELTKTAKYSIEDVDGERYLNKKQGCSLVGYVDGEELRVGFKKSEEIRNENTVYEYRSGPYTVEVFDADDGRRMVHVTSDNPRERTYKTTLMQSENKDTNTIYYELPLPTALVRELGFDEYNEVGDGSKGIHIAIETRNVDGDTITRIRRAETVEGYLRTVDGDVLFESGKVRDTKSANPLHPAKTNNPEAYTADEDKYVRLNDGYTVDDEGYVVDADGTRLTDDGAYHHDEDGYLRNTETRSHVRRIQRKPVSRKDAEETYYQYYLYYPRTLSAALGLDSVRFKWQDATDENGHDYLRAEMDGEASFDLEGTDINYKPYSDTEIKGTDSPRYSYLRSRGANSQTRLVLRNVQSKALGFLTEDDEGNLMPTEEIKNKEKKVTVLVESGPSGFTLVIHPDPDALTKSRRAKRNTLTATVNNYYYREDDDGEQEVVSGNQIALNFPKDIAHSLGLVTVDEPTTPPEENDKAIYWWPTADQYYDSDEMLLVGKQVDEDFVPGTKMVAPADD